MDANQGLTDLNTVITLWAKKTVKKTLKVDPKKHRLEVGLERVTFTPVQTTWARRPSSIPAPPNTTIYQTSFTNNTDHDAQNNLKVERTSKATFKATVLKGFTTSTDMKLHLDLPEDVSAAAIAFGRTITLDRSEETVIEQQQKWSVDSLIPAPPRSVTKARVDIKENHWEGNFSTLVKIKGRVLVRVIKNKAPEKFVGVVEGDVATIFKGYGTSVAPGEVIWNLEGKCSFDFGVEQLISVEHESEKEAKLNEVMQQQGHFYPSIQQPPSYGFQ